jgi:hypothetical protein
MPYRNRDVEAALLNKFQFVDSQTRSDNHRWIELALPGLPVIATHFSHGRQEIDSKLWGKIARQLRVRARYLSEMIDCTKSRDEYYKQVTDEPYPPWAHRF